MVRASLPVFVIPCQYCTTILPVTEVPKMRTPTACLMVHHIYGNSMDHEPGLAWLMANRMKSDLSDIILHVTPVDFHWPCFFNAEWHQYHCLTPLMTRLCASGWAVTELTLILALFMLLAEIFIISDRNGGLMFICGVNWLSSCKSLWCSLTHFLLSTLQWQSWAN